MYILHVIFILCCILLYTLTAFPGVKCQEIVEGFRCGPCPDGYTGNGQKCRPRGCEINSCSPGIVKQKRIL